MQSYEKITECTNKHFYSIKYDTYRMFIDRYHDNYSPDEFVNYLAQISHDTLRRYDSIKKKDLVSDLMFINVDDAVDFARCVRGEKYSNEVKEKLIKLNTVYL